MKSRLVLSVVAGMVVTAIVQHFGLEPVLHLTSNAIESVALEWMIAVAAVSLPGLYVTARIASRQHHIDDDTNEHSKVGAEL